MSWPFVCAACVAERGPGRGTCRILYVRRPGAEEEWVLAGVWEEENGGYYRWAKREPGSWRPGEPLYCPGPRDHPPLPVRGLVATPDGIFRTAEQAMEALL